MNIAEEVRRDIIDILNDFKVGQPIAHQQAISWIIDYIKIIKLPVFNDTI